MLGQADYFLDQQRQESESLCRMFFGHAGHHTTQNHKFTVLFCFFFPPWCIPTHTKVLLFFSSKDSISEATYGTCKLQHIHTSISPFSCQHKESTLRTHLFLHNTYFLLSLWNLKIFSPDHLNLNFSSQIASSHSHVKLLSLFKGFFLLSKAMARLSQGFYY